MPGTLRCALRTLYEEIAEFRFDYPLMTVPEAGPKDSLHYYLHKYSETPPYRSVLRLDANGIAQAGNRVTGVSIDLLSLLGMEFAIWAVTCEAGIRRTSTSS
jgi:hypothetical protein